MSITQEAIVQTIVLWEKMGSVRISAYDTAALYIKLRKLSRQLTSNDVALCNGWRDQDAYDKRKRSLQKTLAALCATYALYYYHQTDPRGCSLYIDNAPLSFANYTNGIAIY